jgi:hypothetical protein
LSVFFHHRFPTYDVLDKWDSPSWNDQTRAVIKKRLEDLPERRFLTESEWEILTAICDRLIPQPDRGNRPVPIVPFIDEKLHKNQGDGYRYEGMPPMREAWRQGIKAIDEEARMRWGGGFRDLPHNQQEAVLRAIQHNDARSEAWQGLPPKILFEPAAAHNRQRLLRAPGGLERDRLWRSGLAARLCPARVRPPRLLGSGRAP